MRSMSEILSDALASFEDGKRWTRGTLFRSKNGESFSTVGKMNLGAEQAETFCAYGAIYRSMYKHGEMSIDSCDQRLNVCGWVEQVIRPHNSTSVVQTNDNASGFEEVRKMFCKGIKRALLVEESGASIDQLKTGHDPLTNQPVDYIEQKAKDDPAT